MSRAVTPGTHALVAESCRRLRVPRARATAYVYASSDLQAECLSLYGERCLIRLSSALIERLHGAELGFVIGHELGHFLLGHTQAGLPPADSLERFSVLRAREVSCDRLGLVAAGEVEAAVRAVMKTLSGLTAPHLRFDVAQFLRSLGEEPSPAADPIEAYATHPSLPLRARCLVWFDAFWREHATSTGGERARAAFQRLDQRVAQDFDRHSERAARELTDSLLDSASSWLWLAAAVSAGRLGGEAQRRLEQRFGGTFVEKARRNFSEMSAGDVQGFVYEKAEAAVRAFIRASPSAASDLIDREIRASSRHLLAPSQAHPLRSVLQQFD